MCSVNPDVIPCEFCYTQEKEGVYEGHSVGHGTYFLGPNMWRHEIEYVHLNACGMLPSDGRICTGTTGMRQANHMF
jgi:hypothetical protein